MPSIASIFRPKIIRRVLLLGLLAAPIVYLFGTQIAGLAGAHGEEVLAETPYQEEWIETTDFQNGTDFKFVISKDLDFNQGHQWNFNFSVDAFSNNPCLRLLIDVTNGAKRWRCYFSGDASVTLLSSQFTNILFWETSNIIYFDSSSLPNISLLDYGTLYYKNPVQNVNYHDSLFNNMFGRSNFLTDWGTSVLDDTAVGFEPVNALLQYVGGDMLHLGDTQIGLMALGYSTYVFNVLIVYMLVSLCASLICLPLKVTDIFNRGDNL